MREIGLRQPDDNSRRTSGLATNRPDDLAASPLRFNHSAATFAGAEGGNGRSTAQPGSRIWRMIAGMISA